MLKVVIKDGTVINPNEEEGRIQFQYTLEIIFY